ncbi:orotidine-5'-phosphate decarboxylase [Vagococcus lutrae]|uniref:orotidine-5'-phosphate decarboxylase n=1 Tax=Vagococcus lutrae TaxID=81947 RepID=UPI00200BF5F7|nr:orotidine-5'-phosphate decarboxylase [Vagococcus lutrae]MDT2806348.1 orotidine-5'-phosphate decarboxylase [Vagococcus lutrae]MDT2824600.1 orotidine-5'-phosphate decarboxylase [Vagococcus lutrae]UQF19234.1 orotidine-5'-phosphate decarboxylase [Vagococcus lutrae]
MHRPIIALDFPNQNEVLRFLSQFPDDLSLFVKVGMELFYQEGPSIVHLLKEKGHDVFLDLKLHDIPNTVQSAMKGIAKLGVTMTNVHAAGGVAMMEAALAGLHAGSQSKQKAPILLAVTQLTSTSEEMMQADQGIKMSLNESVLHYATEVKKSGLDGVVCSALEVEMLKGKLGEDFVCLTPGIRPFDSQRGDQQRVVTPQQARNIGSDYIVVGRPITQAANPFAAYQRIKEEWNGAK